MYATFNDSGFPTGFYDETLHGEYGSDESLIPHDAIKITRNQWRSFIDNQGMRRWEDGYVVPYEPPGPTADELAAAAQRINEFPNLEPDQFWFVVKASGHEQDLYSWISSLNDPENPDYDPVAWAAASSKLQYAKFFERDHPLVEAAREAIGMAEQELDALWKYAAQ